MIRNIIFDLGNVLLAYQPRAYLRSKGLGGEELEFVHSAIFLSEEWVELDRGTLTREQAFQRICERFPERASLIMDFFDFDDALIPYRDRHDILSSLKDHGYRLFYLTNYHRETFTYVKGQNTFFHCFQGGVVSSHVNLLKPDPAIYRWLLKQYALIPRESLFIDDTRENVDAAQELGFKTLHLTEPQMLEKNLKAILFSNTSTGD